MPQLLRSKLFSGKYIYSIFLSLGFVVEPSATTQCFFWGGAGHLVTCPKLLLWFGLRRPRVPQPIPPPRGPPLAAEHGEGADVTRGVLQAAAAAKRGPPPAAGAAVRPPGPVPPQGIRAVCHLSGAWGGVRRHHGLIFDLSRTGGLCS